MPAFRILDQSPVYLDLQGNLAAGGTLHFYEAGSTTDKDVYGDQGLSVNNGPTIAIGSDGRAVDDVWGSGSYRERLYAADGTLVYDRDNLEIPGGTGTAIPTLDAGKFLTNDGAVLQWDTVLQPPDPTGQNGKVVGSDGSSLVWQAPPVAPTLPPLPTGGVASTTSSITAGKTIIQTGSGSLPASGTTVSTANITFPIAMASCSHVGIQMEGTNGAYVVATKVIGRNGTGFTVSGDTNIYQINFNATVPFTYHAFGVLA